MKNCLLSGCLPFLLTWHNDARACYSFAVKWYLNYAVLCLCAWPIAATTYWWDIKMPVQISDTVPELERSYDLIRYRDSQLIFSGACTPQTQREGHEETRQEIAKWQKKLYRRKRPSRARSFCPSRRRMCISSLRSVNCSAQAPRPWLNSRRASYSEMIIFR